MAGSAALNDLDYATRAYLEQVNLTLGGDSSISSRDGVATIGLAGAGVFRGYAGFGTSWALNQEDRQVHPMITD